ncbi:ATP-grasp domain-containing protein [Sporosarcina sp. ANT_H38]
MINSILVTGAAGDIGIGMSKVLKDIPWIKDIYGMDVNDQLPTEEFYQEFIKSPAVNHADYLVFMEELIIKYKVELVIPTSEHEIRFFNKKSIRSIKGVPLLMPSFNIMKLGFDKLKTAQYLECNGFPFPWTMLVSEGEPLKIPCIVKSRDSAGSKDMSILTEENLGYYQKYRKDWIYQELLLPNEKEFTSGVFKSKKGEIQTISFRRTLQGGRTGYAEVVKNPIIDSFLKDLASNIDFDGSVNIQFRLTDKGPVIFEINPRFSSTLVFRHKLGFKDVEWAILDTFGELNDLIFDDSSIINKKIFRSDVEIIY